MSYLSSRDERIIVTVIETLEAILVDSSENMQNFEEVSGLSLMCAVLKQMKVKENITHKVIELLTVYLQKEQLYPDYINGREVDQKKSLMAEFLGVQFVKLLESNVMI